MLIFRNFLSNLNGINGSLRRNLSIHNQLHQNQLFFEVESVHWHYLIQRLLIILTVSILISLVPSEVCSIQSANLFRLTYHSVDKRNPFRMCPDYLESIEIDSVQHTWNLSSHQLFLCIQQILYSKWLNYSVVTFNQLHNEVLSII